MSQYRKKPVVIEAITFDELVAHGLKTGASAVNGMPWSFTYQGHAVTHEHDQCYIIPTLEGSMRFTPEDMLITGVKGEIYPCKREIFEATYEAAAPASFQDRVRAEAADLRERLGKLKTFVQTSLYLVPADEAERLKAQAWAMHYYLEVLDRRIAAFKPQQAATSAPAPVDRAHHPV